MQIKYLIFLIQNALQWMLKMTFIVIVVIICFWIYGAKIEPNWIEIVPIQLSLPHLTPAFNGFKIVQISDLHVSRFMTQKRLDKIINLVNQQKPDVITITGDFDSRNKKFLPDILVEELKKLAPKEFTLSVLGNHDHWNVPQAVRKALAESNAIDLNNQVYTIHRDEEKLNFAGIDDPYVGVPNFPKVLEELPNTGATILLVHEPDFADISASTGRFDLQLSGHSHGGQVRIPLLGAVVLPPGGRKYVSGLTRIGDMIEYTNQGIGMTGIPVRFNCRPEITVFTLKAVS
jgi:predicted MPP superfamily phosphohydrolase